MKRYMSRYEATSFASAVLAVRSIMIGASMSRATGMTTPPNAARFTSGSARRAITAATAGPSRPIASQLAASGAQRRATAA